MKRFFLFMVIFGLAFAGIQKVEAEEVAVTAIKASDVKTLNIPCVKAEGIFYNVNLKEYPLSDAKKTELNLNSQEVSFWQLANATEFEQAHITATCGKWDEKTFDFDSCQGDFRFRRDMEGKDVFGFFWIRYPKYPVSAIVSQSTVDMDLKSGISQDVRIYFISKYIESPSYEATDGKSGNFTPDANGYFNVTLNFSSPGVKTVKISGTDPLCGAYTDTKTITVKDPCDEISPPSISNLKATAVKQVVSVSFGANPNIEKASYTTSDGTPGGDFTGDGKGNFTGTLNFSTSGKKTITVNVVNICKKTASKSVDVLVCGDKIAFSVDGNKVYFGDGKKYFSTGYDPEPKPSDLLLFDFNRTITVRESATKHLVSFDYTVDPSNTQIKVKISDNFREIQTPFAEFDVQTSGSYSSIIIPHDGLYDILIEATDQCGTYQKVFSVQFQRP